MMFERFTRSARAVVTSAVAEAEARGERHVGTEHLLIAIGDARDVAVDGALARSGVKPGAFREGLLELEKSSLTTMGLDPSMAGPGAGGRKRHIPFTAGGKECLDRTLRVALARGDRLLGVEHLALAIFERGERDPAIQVIRQLGLDPLELSRQLDQELRRGA